MSERITDSVLLMGLIVKTKPYEYKDNILSCIYESHVNIDDLKDLKSRLEDELKNYSESSITDEIRSSYEKDLYFLDTVIQELSKGQ